MTPDELRTSLEAAQAAIAEMIAALGDEDPTEEQVAAIEEKEAEAKALANRLRIANVGASAASLAGQSAGRQVVPQPNAAVASSVMPTRTPATARDASAVARGGFATLGEFMFAVAGMEYNRIDPRLVRAASTAPGEFMSEQGGADGGYMIPPQWRNEFFRVVTEDSLASRCDNIPISGPSIRYPVDESTAWGAGVTAYWREEAGAMTEKKPSLKTGEIYAHSLDCLVPVTEELLADAPAAEAFVSSKAQEQLSYKLSLAIMQGTGAGQPLGIINSPALVTVADEASQPATKILYTNILNMFSRMYPAYLPDAVWLVNPAVLPLLAMMPFDDAADSKIPVYLPANGASQSPYGTLMGRPVIPTECCNAVGTVGDIVFASLKQYAVVTRSNSAEQSIHLWFDRGIRAYRFTMRVGGKPWLSSPISPRVGSGTYSPFVALAVRDGS